MINYNDNVWYLGIYEAKVVDIFKTRENGPEVIDLYKIFVEPWDKIVIAYLNDLKLRVD